jgi:hypothetical protein
MRLLFMEVSVPAEYDGAEGKIGCGMPKKAQDKAGAIKHND